MMRWGWNERRKAKRRAAGGWLRPLSKAAPYIILVVAVEMLHIISGSLSTARGVLFELPAADALDMLPDAEVALVVRSGTTGETLVFFDDSRYVLGEAQSLEQFSSQLSARISRTGRSSLVVLADRSANCGDLLLLSDAARKAGCGKILFAAKSPSTAGEEGE